MNQLREARRLTIPRVLMASLAAAVLFHAGCAGSTPDAAASDARIAALAPSLYKLDVSAPFAFTQWPATHHYAPACGQILGPTFGVAMAIWPERATLIVDATPLAAQLQTLPGYATTADAVRRLRINRRNFTLQQCPAIARLYSQGVALSENPKATEKSLFAPSVVELVVNLNGARKRYGSDAEISPYVDWLGTVWRELDSCSKAAGR